MCHILMLYIGVSCWHGDESWSSKKHTFCSSIPNEHNGFQNTRFLITDTPFKKFECFLQNNGNRLHIQDITHFDIIRFLAENTQVSKKTLLNYHTGLSSLWNWATQEGLCKENIVRKVKLPKPEKRVITPFSREEFMLLFKATDESVATVRDKAILLLMLDTGLRASELGKIRIQDVDFHLDASSSLEKEAKKERCHRFEFHVPIIEEYLLQIGIFKTISIKSGAKPQGHVSNWLQTDRRVLFDLSGCFQYHA